MVLINYEEVDIKAIRYPKKVSSEGFLYQVFFSISQKKIRMSSNNNSGDFLLNRDKIIGDG